MAAELVVVTPWYPTAEHPYAGTFVRSWLATLDRDPATTTIVHLENVPADDTRQPTRVPSDLGDVVWIPVPVTALQSRPSMARAQLAALRAHLPAELARARLVHAHVGMPTAWAVSQVVRRDTHLVVTEHASYLGKLLRDPESRGMYAELARRAAHLLTVSEQVARMLRGAYPGQAHKVATIGNPVPDLDFPLVDRPDTALRHWVYVGNLLAAKGVTRLVRAFAEFATEHPGARLTLAGHGPEEGPLRALVAELGLGGSVVFRGAVEHDAVRLLFEEADVLVHLSHVETFGLTVLEAVLTGLPVVVTTCGGPQETLADAAADGLVRFVPVADETTSVVDAVHELEWSAPLADRAEIRAEIAERFGRAAFAQHLAAALGLAPAPPAPTDAAGVSLVGIAFSGRAAERLVPLFQVALRSGARVTLVTNQRSDSTTSDPRVRVVQVAVPRWANPVRVVERGVLRWLPVRALRLARRLVLGTAADDHQEPSTRAGRWLDTAESGRAEVARVVHDRLLSPLVYGFTDPLLAAHWALRKQQEIERHGIDVLLHGDEAALPLTWRLARRHPTATVLGAVSGTELRRAIRAAAGPHPA